MKTLGAAVITLALILGLVGCGGGNGGNGDGSYTLIVDFTVGGAVAVDDVPLPGKAILTYDAGTVASLSAVPDVGYRFVEWTGNVSTIADVDAGSTTITVDGDYCIAANFIAQYVLIIDSTDGGEVTAPGEGTFTYDAGALVQLIAQPSTCYRFVDWIGDETAIADVNAASTTIIMNGNYTVTAGFISVVDQSIVGKLTEVEADPQHGFHWAYYLYVPNSLCSLDREHRTTYLLVEPNNTGYPSDHQEVHHSAAMGLAHARKSYAEELGVVLLVPTFPRPLNPHLYIQALDRTPMLSRIDEYERIDLQLLSMIDDARGRLSESGITIQERILMWGYSASGMFVSRFAAMHPDRIQAATIGAPGGWPIAPLEQWEGISLTYPFGVADIEVITGKEFDIDEFRSIPLYFYMGDLDTADHMPYSQGYNTVDLESILEHLGATPVERWPIAEEMYESAGCNSQFVLYVGVGHQITSAMWVDTRNFLLNNMGP